MGWIESIAGAGSTGKSLAGAWEQPHEARQASRRQREYATMMSNTAHRREMNDLIKAGLNPILTATGGLGASSPTPPPQQIQGTSGAAASAASSALGIRRANEELKNISAIRRSNEVSASLDEGMLGFYDSSTALKTATNAGMLSKRANVSSNIGAAVGAGSSAVKIINRNVDKLMQSTEKSHYDRLNKSAIPLMKDYFKNRKKN